jgi:hypothetical protein
LLEAGLQGVSAACFLAGIVSFCFRGLIPCDESLASDRMEEQSSERGRT